MTLFGTAGIRGAVDEKVTPELALAVGRAVGVDGDAVVVGYDGRETSPALASAVEAGVESAGGTVLRAGQVPTPALAFASRGRRGVMITASHQPGPRQRDQTVRRRHGVRQRGRTTNRRPGRQWTDTASWDEWTSPRSIAPLSNYREAVATEAETHGATPTDLTVAVDCGNGMAGPPPPQVLRRLGADVRALEANVDGTFPARESKPTPESLEALREFVANTDADIGIGHDGDADRIVVVAADGSVVHEDTIVAILAEHYVRETTAEEPVVVTTPNASARIDERVRAAGGSVERVRLGALHEGSPGRQGRSCSPPSRGNTSTRVSVRGSTGRRARPSSHSFVADRGAGRPARAHHRAPYRKVSVDCPDDAKEPVMAALHSSLLTGSPTRPWTPITASGWPPRRFVDARPTLRHGGVRPRLRRERRRRRLVSTVVADVEDAVEAES